MSLPIVMIFERHWDEIPKQVVNELLPHLIDQGYDTLCFEAPQDLTASELIARHNSGVEFDNNLLNQAEKLLKQVNIIEKLSDLSFSSLVQLMRLYVSSQKYIDVAEKIQNLPASRLLKTLFEQVNRHSLLLKGVDIDAKDFDAMTSGDVLQRHDPITKNETQRVTTLFRNLVTLKGQRGGVIFMGGALHAHNLLAKFAENNRQDEVLYYFPHSPRRFDDSLDDIAAVMNETLHDHTHLLTQQQVKPFVKRIVSEIVPKIGRP